MSHIKLFESFESNFNAMKSLHFKDIEYDAPPPPPPPPPDRHFGNPAPPGDYYIGKSRISGDPIYRSNGIMYSLDVLNNKKYISSLEYHIPVFSSDISLNKDIIPSIDEFLKK